MQIALEAPRSTWSTSDPTTASAVKSGFVSSCAKERTGEEWVIPKAKMNKTGLKITTPSSNFLSQITTRPFSSQQRFGDHHVIAPRKFSAKGK
jgi:hypothetical protein